MTELLDKDNLLSYRDQEIKREKFEKFSSNLNKIWNEGKITANQTTTNNTDPSIKDPTLLSDLNIDRRIDFSGRIMKQDNDVKMFIEENLEFKKETKNEFETPFSYLQSKKKDQYDPSEYENIKRSIKFNSNEKNIESNDILELFSHNDTRSLIYNFKVLNNFYNINIFIQKPIRYNLCIFLLYFFLCFFFYSLCNNLYLLIFQILKKRLELSRILNSKNF